MDEAHQEELLTRARRTVLAEANSHKGSLGAAVQRITDECGPDGFEDLIKEAMRHAAIFARAGYAIRRRFYAVLSVWPRAAMLC